MTEQPIGANITYKYLGSEEEYSGYVSFGRYDEETNCSMPDGLNDDYIFYYCSQEELVRMVGVPTTDWVVLSIDLYSYSTYEGMSNYGNE